jgi:predicted nucleic acid-binding protein
LDKFNKNQKVDMKGKRTSVDLSNIFLARSEKLKDLAAVMETWSDLQGAIPGVARFRLVVDTNVVLGDLLWLVCERTDSSAMTHLMETTLAGTIDLFAPPSFFEEVEEKIPLLAAQRGFDIALMYIEWDSYKKIIQVAEPDHEKVIVLKEGVDPDDADFIALAQTIGASGVISKDRHIRLMGGNQISVECITYLRNYSRATAIELNIKVNGVQFVLHSCAAIREFSTSMSSIQARLNAAPDWVKVGLVAVSLFILFDPKARASTGGILRTILSGVSEVTPVALALVVEAASHAHKHKTTAKSQLNKAMKQLQRGSEAPLGCDPGSPIEAI